MAKKSRLESADYVFFALASNDFTDIPECLRKEYELGKLYLVGNKNFGENNGIIYNRRGQPNYFESSISLDNDYIEQTLYID